MTVALVANIARPISSAISTAFSDDSYGALSSYGLLSGSAVVDPDAVIEALFASGEQGAWYDPSDLSTMFQDSAGTTPVTADGQPVGLILDKSGNDNHAVAPSDAARPLYKTDGTYHWIMIDGVDDKLSSNPSDFTSTKQISMFGGLHDTLKLGWRIPYGLISGSSVASGSCILQLPNSNTNQSSIGWPTSQGAFNQVVASKADKELVVTQLFNYEVATNQIIMRADAIQVGVGDGTIATQGFGTLPIQIGTGDADGMNGNIYSFIILGRLATTQEITDTETWVNGKTGAY